MGRARTYKWAWGELAGSAWERALKHRLLGRPKPTSIYMRHPDDDSKDGDELKPVDNPLVACALRVVWELSGEVRAAVFHGACTVRSGELEREVWPLGTSRLVFYMSVFGVPQQSLKQKFQSHSVQRNLGTGVQFELLVFHGLSVQTEREFSPGVVFFL